MAGVDRLVVLGDLLELRHGPLRPALDAAVPIIGELAAALGSDGELLVVPGNHDHRLLRGWLERRAAEGEPSSLGLESVVGWRPDEPLAALARAAEPAALRVAYPGVWLRDGVYATHGHYLDRHITVPILERLGAGLMGKLVAEPAGSRARAESYEAVLGPIYAWIDALAQSGMASGRSNQPSLQVRAWRSLVPAARRRPFRRAIARGAFAAVVTGLNAAGLGPLRPGLGGDELRVAGLRAFGEVLRRLDVRASHAIFGHTHRAGPLPGDDRQEWTAPGGISMLNTGSWLYEPGLLGEAPRQSPYRPGFCALIEDEGPPRLINVLDG